jgi:hypothetical protein
MLGLRNENPNVLGEQGWRTRRSAIEDAGTDGRERLRIVSLVKMSVTSMAGLAALVQAPARCRASDIMRADHASWSTGESCPKGH